ncbi:hypothetical protein Bhyg_10976 [Pseudolycoriella hygida]|uniref:Uncharacterized protein n=1 Tax=Pseudolycoriella hygida TaxID=35572 RepID=A0A9Q0MUJ0_9DIPT|nr:hypothetical protein Bhyg_10976 [Pseudolycoriella hygida]
MNLLDDSNLTYYGELQFTYFHHLSNHLELSFDECKAESINALTTCNGLPHFEYELDETVSRFAWIKKKMGCPFEIQNGNLKEILIIENSNQLSWSIAQFESNSFFVTRVET